MSDAQPGPRGDRVRVVELVLSADLAIAAADGAVFARALHALERIGPPGLGRDVAALAALALRDLHEAQVQWAVMRRRLDDEMAASAPRSSR